MAVVASARDARLRLRARIARLGSIDVINNDTSSLVEISNITWQRFKVSILSGLSWEPCIPLCSTSLPLRRALWTSDPPHGTPAGKAKPSFWSC